MMTSGRQIIVLGGGISGISTALVLQSLGFNVSLVADRPQTSGEPVTSEIPTGYAMASAYPHNLRVADLPRVSADSQAVFAYFAGQNGSGVSIYKIFEVFESEPASGGSPPLADCRMNFRSFDGSPESLKQSLDPPVRPGAEMLFGYSFDSYFADMPLYMPYLYAIFIGGGGAVFKREINPESLARFLGTTLEVPLINCLGAGALDLFEDDAPAVMMRGRQALVPDMPVVMHQGMPVAYNYTPTAEVFSRGDGDPEYVHFFPRQDGYLLGQTREPGILDDDGLWSGEAVKGEELLLAGVPVPEPVVSLNAELLRAWKGLEFSRDRLEGRLGYRYYRDPENTGVRLEAQELDGRLVIHNYGHGGSGITMSWGCSLAVTRILLGRIEETTKRNKSELGLLLESLL